MNWRDMIAFVLLVVLYILSRITLKKNVKNVVDEINHVIRSEDPNRELGTHMLEKLVDNAMTDIFYIGMLAYAMFIK